LLFLNSEGAYGFYYFFAEPEDEQSAQTRKMMQLVQLLPILILVLFTLLSFGTGQDDRWYSLSQDDTFKLERRTEHPHVTQHLPYFVKPDFVKRVGGDRYTLLKVGGAFLRFFPGWQ
jgi:hypothetical protein